MSPSPREILEQHLRIEESLRALIEVVFHDMRACVDDFPRV